MILQEFKAWFEGFTDNMGEAPPTKRQWVRIRARVKEIDGAAITYPVFIERYWPGPPLNAMWTCSSGSTIPTTSVTGIPNVKNDGHTVFNSSQAMLALGKADYQAIS